jgi:DNA replication protein DnaC
MMKKTETCICEKCGVEFEGTVWYREEKKFQWSRHCPDCSAAIEAEEARLAAEEYKQEQISVREKWRSQCGIPQGEPKTFENFEVTFHRKSVQKCKEYAEAFDYRGKGLPSLILYSSVPGVGKTHLLEAIGNHIISAWDGDPHSAIMPILFLSGPGLVRRIRATYNRRETREGPPPETEADIYEQLRGIPLLMLDDVGKEKPSDFTREVYWYIIDERVKNRLPVALTSRLPLEPKGPKGDSLVQLMGEDTVDRLYGMTGGVVIDMPGPSYRRRKGVA